MTVDRWGISVRDRLGVIDTVRFHADLARPAHQMAAKVTEHDNTRSTEMYSMYEAYARERMRRQLTEYAQQRLSANLASARMWQRLARYSARQAARSSNRVAENPAQEYQLAG